MEYRTIVCDPPWPYESDGPRSSYEHRPNSWKNPTHTVGSACRYGKMSIEDLCAMDVPAAKDSHLYLWTTNTFMVEAHVIAIAWGFTVKTILTWVKLRPDGTPSMRAGYYYRGATEHVVFAVRGKLRLSGKPEPNAFLSRRLPHSVKPPCFYEMVERQSPGPYLELFARPITPLYPKIDGWSTWGNQIESDITLLSKPLPQPEAGEGGSDNLMEKL